MKKAMKSLDVIGEHEGIDQQARDEYAKLFCQPLTDAHLIALSAMFNWALPEDFGSMENNELLELAA